MKANKKIIDHIYQITFGNLEVDDFISLTKLERKLFIDTIFKSRAHFLIYKLLKYENSYKKYNFYTKAKNIVNFYTYQTMIHLEESHRLNNILNHHKIKFLFLKGVHLLSTYYDDIIERPLRDIDILVQKKDIKRIVYILKKNGYRFEYDIDESSLDNFLINSYDIPVLVGKNGSRLEVHFSIEKSSTEKECSLTKNFFKDSKKIKYGNSCIRVPTEEDLILHLIYHGLKKQGPNVGIIFISDIFKILSSENYSGFNLIKKAKLYNLLPHLKIIVELLCKKSNESNIQLLNKQIDLNIDSNTIKSLEFLLIRNDIYDEELRVLKIIEDFSYKELAEYYNAIKIQRHHKINVSKEKKILTALAYMQRVLRHLKILLFFAFRVLLFKSIRAQLNKMNKILTYIN